MFVRYFFSSSSVVTSIVSPYFCTRVNISGGYIPLWQRILFMPYTNTQTTKHNRKNVTNNTIHLLYKNYEKMADSMHRYHCHQQCGFLYNWLIRTENCAHKIPKLSQICKRICAKIQKICAKVAHILQSYDVKYLSCVAADCLVLICACCFSMCHQIQPVHY